MWVPLWGHHLGDDYEGPLVGVCQPAGLQLSLLSGKVHKGRAHTQVLARLHVLLCSLRRSKVQHPQLAPVEHRKGMT